MGLSDKYAVAPASVAELGFGYDSDVVSRIGGHVWPGVEAAETEFARRAAAQNSKPDALRDRMRAVYRERMDAQRALLRASNPGGRAPEEEDGPES